MNLIPYRLLSSSSAESSKLFENPFPAEVGHMVGRLIYSKNKLLSGLSRFLASEILRDYWLSGVSVVPNYDFYSWF